jgi:hypothetical protein
LLKKSFEGVGKPPLTPPGRARDVACNVPTEKQGIYPPLTYLRRGNGGSRIYLYLDFSMMVSPKS